MTEPYFVILKSNKKKDIHNGNVPPIQSPI